MDLKERGGGGGEIGRNGGRGNHGRDVIYERIIIITTIIN